MTATTSPDLAPLLDRYAGTPAHLRHLDPLWDWLHECGTEADWNALLDAHPDHHDARARFALWLRERGDERADGYAALAARVLRPRLSNHAQWYDREYQEVTMGEHADDPIMEPWSDLPTAWFRALEGGREHETHLRYYETRAEAEDAAALAFLKLPAERRAQLLKGAM